jgi:hypothetical protein
VLPHSTAWFSQFLLHKYNDDRWVAIFRFTKEALFGITALLAPHHERQNQGCHIGHLEAYRRAGMPAHYIGREPGVLDIFSKYSLKILPIY